MQKPFEYTITPNDRAMFSAWLIRIIAFYAVLALIVGGIGLFAKRPGLEPPSEQIGVAGNGRGGAIGRLTDAPTTSGDFMTGMPLP